MFKLSKYNLMGFIIYLLLSAGWETSLCCDSWTQGRTKATILQASHTLVTHQIGSEIKMALSHGNPTCCGYTLKSQFFIFAQFGCGCESVGISGGRSKGDPCLWAQSLWNSGQLSESTFLGGVYCVKVTPNKISSTRIRAKPSWRSLFLVVFGL